MGSKCCKCHSDKNAHTRNTSLISSNNSTYYDRRSRNGRQLSTDRFASYNTRNRSSFAIRQLEFDDAGQYSAEIEDTYGSSKLASIDLTVRPRTPLVPNFVKRLHDVSIKIGSRARFLIEIDSSTPAKVTWYHDNQVVKQTDRFHVLEQNNYYCLDVAWTTLQDEGHWTCIVENKHGCSVSTAYLSIIVPKAYKAPQFVEELRAILGEDETVSLECKVVGVPAPTLQWYKDGKKIKAGDTFALKSNANDLSSLGTYSCVAKNCLGQAFSSSTVRFHRDNENATDKCVTPLGPAPKFVRELRNVEVQIETPLTLSCQVGVPPWPKTIDWYNKSGKIIDIDQKYKTIADGLGMYAMEIKSVEMMDDGEWKCVATNFFGIKAFSSCYVTVKFPKNYKSPKFLENLRAVMTPEGLVSFECKVIGYPTPQLRWLKDGRELKPGDVYQLTGTNSLGTYCCIAKNPMGELKSTTMLTLEDIQTQLTDEERLMIYSTNQPPYYIKGLMSQEAKINEEFQFSVQVNAKPEPNILWYRNDELIEQNERISISRENERCYSLHIKNLHLLDQAEWKCVAVNDFGQSVTSCFLKLIIPKHYKAPKFLEELRANFTKEGTVNLDCKVIGVPQPELRWYKDGERLQAGQMHKIISGAAGTCCLGTYTCEAINCMATSYSSASLRALTADTKPPIQKQTNPFLDSLSVIIEEQTSQLNNTSDKSTTYEEAAGVSFSFDGKEVSISLYETPDLTEEEALQIVEMYANELTKQITEQNVVELPSLRFIKETTISGNIMMEATIVDVPANDFNVEDELKTDADVENSMMDDSAFVTNNSTYSDDVSADKITFNSDFSHNILQTSQSCIDDLPNDETKIKATKISSSVAANKSNDADKAKPDDQTRLQKRKSFGSEDDSLHEFERLKATKATDDENTIPEVTCGGSRNSTLERIKRAVDRIEQNVNIVVDADAHPIPLQIVDPLRQMLAQINVILSLELTPLTNNDNVLNLVRQAIADFRAFVDTIGDDCDTNSIAIGESIRNATRQPLSEIENELQSTDVAKSLVDAAKILDEYSQQLTDLERRLQTLPTAICGNHQNLIQIVRQMTNVKDWFATLYENYAAAAAEQNAIPHSAEFVDILSQYLDTNIDLVDAIVRRESSLVCDKFVAETKPAREALTHTLQIVQFLSPSTGIEHLSNALKCVTAVGQHTSLAMATSCDDDSFVVDANCVKWADDSIEIILNSLSTIAKCTNADISYHKKRLLLRFDGFRDPFSALQRQLHSIERQLPAEDHRVNGIQAYKIVSELSEPLQYLRCQIATFVDDYKIYCTDDSLEAIVRPILPTLDDLRRRISNFHEIVFDQDVDCIDFDCILYALNNLNPSLCELANGMMQIEEIILAETPIINDPKLGIRVVIQTVSNLVDAVVALRAIGDSDPRCSILLKLHDPLVEIRNSLDTINNRFYEEELDRINITMLKTLSTPFNNLQRTLLEIADSVPVADLKRPVGDLQRTILAIQDQVSFEYGDEPASIEYNIITLQTLIQPMNVLKRCCIDAANADPVTRADDSRQPHKRDDTLSEIEHLLDDLEANKALKSVLTSNTVWRSISAMMKSYQALVNCASNSDAAGKCARTIRLQFNRIEHIPDAMLSDVIAELGNLVDAIESPSSNFVDVQSTILDKLHSNLLTLKNANFQDDDCMKCSIALLQSIDTIRTLKENMGHYSSNASTSDSVQSSMLISFVNTCERLEIRVSDLLYILESQSADLLPDEFYRTAVLSFRTLNSQLIRLNKCLVEQSMSEDDQKEIPFQSSIECFNKLLNYCATDNDGSRLKQIASHIKNGIIDEIDRLKDDILFNMALIQTEDEVTINESDVFEENLNGTHADLFAVCLKSIRDEFRKCDQNIAQISRAADKLKPLRDTNTNIENLSNIIRFVDKNIPFETNSQKICISQLHKPAVRILQKIRQIETSLTTGEQTLPLVEQLNMLNDMYEKLKLAASDVIRVARADERKTNESTEEAQTPSASADFVTIRDKRDSIESDELSSSSSDDKPSLIESSSFSSDILCDNNGAETRTKNLYHIPECESESENQEPCDTVDENLSEQITDEELENAIERKCDSVLPTVQLFEDSPHCEVASELDTTDKIENVDQIVIDNEDLAEFQTGIVVFQDDELQGADDEKTDRSSPTVNSVQIDEDEQTVQPILQFAEQCSTDKTEISISESELRDAIQPVENIHQNIFETENLIEENQEKSCSSVEILETNELQCADTITPVVIDFASEPIAENEQLCASVDSVNSGLENRENCEADRVTFVSNSDNDARTTTHPDHEGELMRISSVDSSVSNADLSEEFWDTQNNGCVPECSKNHHKHANGLPKAVESISEQESFESACDDFDQSNDHVQECETNVPNLETSDKIECSAHDQKPSDDGIATLEESCQDKLLLEREPEFIHDSEIDVKNEEIPSNDDSESNELNKGELVAESIVCHTTEESITSNEEITINLLKTDENGAIKSEESDISNNIEATHLSSEFPQLLNDVNQSNEANLVANAGVDEIDNTNVATEETEAVTHSEKPSNTVILAKETDLNTPISTDLKSERQEIIAEFESNTEEITTPESCPSEHEAKCYLQSNELNNAEMNTQNAIDDNNSEIHAATRDDDTTITSIEVDKSNAYVDVTDDSNIATEETEVNTYDENSPNTIISSNEKDLETPTVIENSTDLKSERHEILTESESYTEEVKITEDFPSAEEAKCYLQENELDLNAPIVTENFTDLKSERQEKLTESASNTEGATTTESSPLEGDTRSYSQEKELDNVKINEKNETDDDDSAIQAKTNTDDNTTTSTQTNIAVIDDSNITTEETEAITNDENSPDTVMLANETDLHTPTVTENFTVLKSERQEIMAESESTTEGIKITEDFPSAEEAKCYLQENELDNVEITIKNAVDNNDSEIQASTNSYDDKNESFEVDTAGTCVDATDDANIAAENDEAITNNEIPPNTAISSNEEDLKTSIVAENSADSKSERQEILVKSECNIEGATITENLPLTENGKCCLQENELDNVEINIETAVQNSSEIPASACGDDNTTTSIEVNVSNACVDVIDDSNIATEETEAITCDENSAGAVILSNEKDLHTPTVTENFTVLKSERQEIIAEPEPNTEEVKTTEDFPPAEEAKCYLQENELDNVEINIENAIGDDSKIQADTCKVDNTTVTSIEVDTANACVDVTDNPNIATEEVAAITYDENSSNTAILANENDLHTPIVTENSTVLNSERQEILTESESKIAEATITENLPLTENAKCCLQENELDDVDINVETAVHDSSEIQASNHDDNNTTITSIEVDISNACVDLIPSDSNIATEEAEAVTYDDSSPNTVVLANEKDLQTPTITENSTVLNSERQEILTTESESNFEEATITENLPSTENAKCLQENELDTVEINTETAVHSSSEIQASTRDDDNATITSTEVDTANACVDVLVTDNSDIATEETDAVTYDGSSPNTVILANEEDSHTPIDTENSTVLKSKRQEKLTESESKIGEATITENLPSTENEKCCLQENELDTVEINMKNATDDDNGMIQEPINSNDETKISLLESAETDSTESEKLNASNDINETHPSLEIPHSSDNVNQCTNTYNEDNKITSIEVNTANERIDVLDDFQDSSEDVHYLQESPCAIDTAMQSPADLMNSITSTCTRTLESVNSLEELPCLSDTPKECFENDDTVGPDEVKTTEICVKILEDTDINDHNSDLLREDFQKNLNEAIDNELLDLTHVTEELITQNNKTTVTPSVTDVPDEPASNETFTLSRANIQQKASENDISDEKKDYEKPKISSVEENFDNEISSLVESDNADSAIVSDSIAETNETARCSSEIIRDSKNGNEYIDTSIMENSQNDTSSSLIHGSEVDNQILKVLFPQENTIESSNTDATVPIKDENSPCGMTAQLSNILYSSDFAKVNVDHALQQGIENTITGEILNGSLRESYPESHQLRNEVQSQLENLNWENTENRAFDFEKELANADETRCCSSAQDVIESMNCPEVKFYEDLSKDVIHKNEILENEAEQQSLNILWELVNESHNRVENESAIAVQTLDESLTFDTIRKVYQAEVKIMDEKQPTDIVNESDEKMTRTKEHFDDEKIVPLTNNNAEADKSAFLELDNQKEQKLQKLLLETNTAKEKDEEMMTEGTQIFDGDKIQKYTTNPKCVEDYEENIIYHVSIQHAIDPFDSVECTNLQKNKPKNSTDDDSIEEKQSASPTVNDDLKKKEYLLPEIKTARESVEGMKMENAEILESDKKLEKCTIKLLEPAEIDERNFINQNSVPTVIEPIDSKSKLQEKSTSKNDEVKRTDKENYSQNEAKLLLDDQVNSHSGTKMEHPTVNKSRKSMNESKRIDSTEDEPIRTNDDKVIRSTRRELDEETRDINVAPNTKNETNVRKNHRQRLSTPNGDINKTKSDYKDCPKSAENESKIERISQMKHFHDDTAEENHTRNNLSRRWDKSAYARSLETERLQAKSQPMSTNYRDKLWKTNTTNHFGTNYVRENNIIVENNSHYPIPHIHFEEFLVDTTSESYPKRHLTSTKNNYSNSMSESPYLNPNYGCRHRSASPTRTRDRTPSPTHEIFSDPVSNSYNRNYRLSASPTHARDRTPSPTLDVYSHWVSNSHNRNYRSSVSPARSHTPSTVNLYSNSVSNSYDRNYELRLGATHYDHKRSFKWREFEDTHPFRYGQFDSKFDYIHESDIVRDTRYPRLEFGSFSYWHSNWYHKNRISHYRRLIKEAEDILTKFEWHDPWFNWHHFVDFPLFRKTFYDIPHTEYQTSRYSTEHYSATPRFKYLCAENKVPVGNTVTLHVEVEGTPKPNIEWLREGKTLMPAASRYHYIEDSDLHTLVISDFSYNDAGNYKCMAWNTYGMANTTTSIGVVTNNVYERGKPPMFITRPSTIMSVNCGSDVSVSFRLSGDPKPKVFWMKGLTDITESNRTCKETINDYTRLILNRAQISDAGTYFIIAKNKYGTDRAFFTLRVNQRSRSPTPIPTTTTYKYKTNNYSSYGNHHKQSSLYYHKIPAAISGEPYISDWAKNRVTLSWPKPIHCGGGPILAYRVEGWQVGQEGGAKWVELGTSAATSLEIYNLNPNYKYNFRVTAKNQYGWGESRTTSNPLTIEDEAEFPEFEICLPGELKVLHGSTVELECKVKHEKGVKVEWYQDGALVEQDDARSLSFVDGRCLLKIIECQNRHSGRYVCEAFNSRGKVCTFVRLMVVTDPKIVKANNRLNRLRHENEGKIDMAPQFTLRLRNKRVQIGFPVRLTCQVIGYPKPLVTWFKSDQALTTDKYYSIYDEADNFHSLEINYALDEHKGEYNATATNSSGSVSCKCELIVDKGLRNYVAPAFVEKLKPTYTVVEHSDLRIRAKVEAYPHVGITWRKNGIRLRPSRHIIMTLSHEGEIELTIARINQLESGVYTCVATNELGQAETNTRIEVYSEREEDVASSATHSNHGSTTQIYSKEPKFLIKPRVCEAIEGDRVIIECHVIGDPKPDISWLRDRLKLDYYRDKDEFEFHNDETQPFVHQLVIPRVKFDHTGAYTIIAKNEHGEAKAIVSLQVFTKDTTKIIPEKNVKTKYSEVEKIPQIKRHLCDIKCCDGDSVTFECEIETVRNPSDIDYHWYKNGKLIPLDDGFTTNVTANVASFVIQEVYPEDEGQYSCVVSNSLGTATSTACLIVNVPEEKESSLSRHMLRPSGLRSRSTTPLPGSVSSLPARENHPPDKMTESSKSKPSSPKFYSAPQGKVAVIGDTVRLQCSISGCPSPNATWSRYNVPISSTNRIDIREQDDLRILEISKVTPEDEGLYKVIVENDFGHCDATVRLDVIKK